MYRVVLYGLAAIICVAFILSILQVLWIGPTAFLVSLGVIMSTLLLTHYICVRVWKAPGNLESSLITGLILFLILTPSVLFLDLILNACIGVSAILAKYLIQYRHRHIFNPVALSLFGAGLFGYTGVEWWVGSRYVLPVVLVAGLIVVIKTRRFPLVVPYICISALVAVLSFAHSTPAVDTLVRHFISWPTLFFAAFMLTEPLGLPSTYRLQYGYVAIVGILSGVPFTVGPLHGTPELALLVGNLYTFIVDVPARLRLRLSKKREVGKNICEYSFHMDTHLTYTPGQYLEWTLPHRNPDARGIRRYFTISSAPHADELSFAVRHGEVQSTWKQALGSLPNDGVLYATQRAGDFTLRQDAPHHVWIAGGIGITPFVSMIRNALQNEQQILATLFYCNKTFEDIAFLDELNMAKQRGLTVVYMLDVSPALDFVHEKGRITEQLIHTYVSEWSEATYYISGPPPFVHTYRDLGEEMGIPSRRIVTDYFPGLA
jgi:glycine betaine catabolism B